MAQTELIDNLVHRSRRVFLKLADALYESDNIADELVGIGGPDALDAYWTAHPDSPVSKAQLTAAMGTVNTIRAVATQAERAKLNQAKLIR